MTHQTTYTERDKYGRSVRHICLNGKTICVRVTLPVAYREQTGIQYLVTDWTLPYSPNRDASVTDCHTITEARAAEARIVARETAKIAA